MQEALGLKTKTVEEDQRERMGPSAPPSESEGEKSDAGSDSSDDMLGAICGGDADKKVPRRSGLPASSSRGAASASAPKPSRLPKPSPSKPLPCPSPTKTGAQHAVARVLPHYSASGFRFGLGF